MTGTSNVKIGDVNDIVGERKFASMTSRIDDSGMTTSRWGPKTSRREMGTPPEEKDHFLHRVRFASRGDTKFYIEKIEHVMQHKCPSRPFHSRFFITFFKRSVATPSRCDRLDVAKCTIP